MCGATGFLKLISGNKNDGSCLLPFITHLAMARSMQLTDIGLLALGEGSIRQQTLTSLDITFCRNTRYDGPILALGSVAQSMVISMTVIAAAAAAAVMTTMTMMTRTVMMTMMPPLLFFA